VLAGAADDDGVQRHMTASSSPRLIVNCSMGEALEQGC
jgi:hypothetical protein